VLHQARQGDARLDTDLVEDVAQVALDGLLAQEQFRRDLWVRLPIHDKPGDLKLATRKSLEPHRTRSTPTRSPVRTVAELPELLFRALAISGRPAGVKRLSGPQQLAHGRFDIP
jgi:hypothetical protein